MRNIKVIKTPDERFENLKDYPFKPNYIEVENGINIHYVDEGKENKKVIFLFHGQPTWSYVYRNVISDLVKRGYRVIAPDLIGFGKSDKPVNQSDITYQNQVDWMTSFVDKLNINNAAAFFQDWGGLIGLRVLADRQNWLSRLIVGNTVLPKAPGLGPFIMPKMMALQTWLAGKTTFEDFEKKHTFGNWSGYFKTAEKLEIGKINQLLTTKVLTDEEMYAYDAPYPSEEYYAAPRTMPLIISQQIKENNLAWEKLKQWEHPLLTLFSDKDPFLANKGYDTEMQKYFVGAKGQPHETITNASHFLQEDQEKILVKKVTSWLDQTKF